MEIHLSEWVGYAASVVVAISLIMSSIIKFRWLNLFGSLLFCVYGFWISAWPIFFFNGCIVCINLYYLYKIYTRKEEFEIIETSEKDVFLQKFIHFHKKEIQKISPDFDFDISKKDFSYFVVRNMTMVGLFLARKTSEKTLSIDLDFVIPEYRDFKNGAFLYKKLDEAFKKSGIIEIKAIAKTKPHAQYLSEMEFESSDNQVFVKHI